MKKNVLVCLMPLFFFLASDALAQECCVEDPCCYVQHCEGEKSFYAKVLGGVNFLQDTKITQNKASYQVGYVVSGSIGYCWRYGLRLEAEYAFRRNAIKNIDFFVEGSSRHGHYQASSCMGNVFWDLPLSSWGCLLWDIQPFIGGGLGYDFQHMHASNSRIIFNQRWRHFSWQLMAGLAYPVFKNTEVTFEYRFHQGGSHFNNHSIGLGLSYQFDFFGL